jgi:hypothetical protein
MGLLLYVLFVVVILWLLFWFHDPDRRRADCDRLQYAGYVIAFALLAPLIFVWQVVLTRRSNPSYGFARS